jgi:hypothetical protein
LLRAQRADGTPDPARIPPLVISAATTHVQVLGLGEAVRDAAPPPQPPAPIGVPLSPLWLVVAVVQGALALADATEVGDGEAGGPTLDALLAALQTLGATLARRAFQQHQGAMAVVTALLDGP